MWSKKFKAQYDSFALNLCERNDDYDRRKKNVFPSFYHHFKFCFFCEIEYVFEVFATHMTNTLQNDGWNKCFHPMKHVRGLKQGCSEEHVHTKNKIARLIVKQCLLLNLDLYEDNLALSCPNSLIFRCNGHLFCKLLDNDVCCETKRTHRGKFCQAISLKTVDVLESKVILLKLALIKRTLLKMSVIRKQRKVRN